MITTLALAALLGGYLFGMRFKVLVLIPAILLGVAIVVIIGLGLGSDAWTIVLAAVLTTVGLQVGYAAAVIASAFIVRRSASPRLRKLRWRREH